MVVDRGGLRILQVQGISVFVHWSWALVALLELQWRSDSYQSVVWNLAEYLALFGIVVLHEFGHALACRSTGGKAERILLWPLGGVAYVQPPQRPGAILWSIAAGPLVNVVLLPITVAAWFLVEGGAPGSELASFAMTVAFINLALLVFNMLPIYPLDGGQILRALLWYVMGRERSLLVAAGVGLVASVAGGLAAFVVLESWWLALLGGYAAWRSWQGVKHARARQVVVDLPRQPVARCPGCGQAPPLGPIVRCPEGHPVDPFANLGQCSACDARFAAVPCFHCGEVTAVEAWMGVSLGRSPV